MTVKMVFIDKYVHMTPISEDGHWFLFSLEPCLQICNYELTHPSVKEKHSPLKHQSTSLYESQKNLIQLYENMTKHNYTK